MAMPFDQPMVCPVLIGRATYLASFERIFEQTGRGQGQTVLVSGEAGIGKSRFVAEVKARIGQSQAWFLQGQCYEQDRSLPLGPLLDALRSLLIPRSRAENLRALAPFAPELIKILPELALWLPEVMPTHSLEPEQEKRRLFVALTHFLLEQAVQRPLLLIIEDLHWSDDTSLEFLQFLSRQGRSQPLLLLLTYRSEEVHPPLARFLSTVVRGPAATELSLTTLSIDDVQAMLRAIFQMRRPVRRDFLEALYTLTEGNPFFVEEVLKSLLAVGDIFFADGMWDRKSLSELHIPRSVYDAVQQRTSLLSTEAREVLELAAVIGRHLDFSLLQVLTGQSQHKLIAVLETLMAAQLLMETSSGQCAFRHALTQQAIYKSLLAYKRTALHLRIAQTIERLYVSTLEAHLSELAYHYYQAEAWAEELSYARRVGEQALAVHTARAALEHFTHALEATSHLPEVNPGALYRMRGQTYQHLGDFERAQSDYEQAVQLARRTGDKQEEWQCLMELVNLMIGHDYQTLGAFFEDLLKLAQVLEDPQKYALSRNLQAHWLDYVGQPDVGITMHEEALAMFQQQGDLSGEARAFEFLGQAAAFQGDIQRAVSYYDRAIALSRAIGDKQILIHSLAFRGYAISPALKEPAFPVRETLATCRQNLGEALHLADEIDWLYWQAVPHFFAGWAFASYGLPGEGIAHAQAALEIATETENPQWMVGSYCALGELHLVLLDPGQALVALETGLAIVLTTRSVYWTGNIRVAMAQAYLLARDFPRAEAALEQIIPHDQFPRTILERRAVWVRGELALALHKPERALRLADGLLASAPGEEQRARGQPIPALLKLRGEALFALGQVDEAIQALEEARHGAQEQSARPLLWRIHRSLARVYTAAKQKDLAHRACVAARETIADVAASVEDVTGREHFLHTALASLPKEQPLTARQSARQAFDGLSSRELKVALLIAQGKSSREIAAMLVISQRTVEGHVANIYSKLGFSSRVQIAAWTIEKGLSPSRTD